MRIYFGILNSRKIKWPKGCAWCNSEPTRWYKYRKKTMQGIGLTILSPFLPVPAAEISSRVASVSYPVCYLHNILAHITKPIRLVMAFLIFNIITVPYQNDIILWLCNLIIASLGYYLWRRGIIVHKVYEKHIELSIPESKYAEEFMVLNECHSIHKHVLIQEE